MKTHRQMTVVPNKSFEQQLFRAVASLKSWREAAAFFQDLCMPAELQAMADRWRVVDLLKQGKHYRQIYDETGVSVTTVGRVARCLALGDGGYNLIYDRIEKKSYESNKITDRNSKRRTLK